MIALVGGRVRVLGTHTAGDREVRGLRRRSKQLEQENEILRRAAAYFACDTLLK